MDPEQIKQNYITESARFRKLEEGEEKLLLLLSLLRLMVFAGGLVLVWFGFTKSLTAGIILLFLLAVSFLYLLKMYSVHSEKKSFLQNLSKINRDEADAIGGDLSAFEAGSSFIDPHHPFSADIDLFGDNSLFRYLNRTVTSYGRDVLARWLSDPFPLAGELNQRQEAIRELACRIEWRQNFLAFGINKSLDKYQIENLKSWMNESVSEQTGIRKFLLVFIPLITIILLILFAFGLIHYSIVTFLFFLNLIIITAGLKKTNRIHRSLTGMHSYLESIHKLIGVFENEDFNSAVLKSIRAEMSGQVTSASVAIKKLGRLIQGFDSRLNLVVGFILNGVLLWDYQCIARLDNWKAAYRNVFPGWLELLGYVDAYISLGNYAFNNPGFIYPSTCEDGLLFSVNTMGHPLIDEKIRVCNDFQIAHKGRICVISGANMSGKSTFLRTVAINWVLASAGAPVCAEVMCFKPMRLFTSMRTTDSLAGNESYFYAELKRLKEMKSEIENGEPVLFILDEILKGTNSADKSLGSKLFIKRIIELGGTGLIATHDTSLGEMETEYPGIIFNKCFEVEIEGDSIKFDYILRDGITRKMNAAILMKQMGIIK